MRFEKTITLFILATFGLSTVSCHSNTKDSVDTSKNIIESPNIDDNYNKFISSFEEIKAPVFIEYGRGFWRNLNHGKIVEIPDSFDSLYMMKYKSLYDKYYVYKFQNTFKDYLGLIFYKSSEPNVSGFYLTLQKPNERAKGELFIAGTIGVYETEGQRNVNISVDGKIVITEYILVGDKMDKANKTVMTYIVSEKGTFEKINEVKTKNIPVKVEVNVSLEIIVEK